MSAGLLSRVMNFVGWEPEDENLMENREEIVKDAAGQAQYSGVSSRKHFGKVVSMPSTMASNQFKMVVMQPESIDDAQEICDHLRDKPVIVNLEALDKTEAQRIIDFLGGAVYALDGTIQRVSSSNWVFIVAPCNVDVAGDFKETLRKKGVFSFFE